MATEPTGWRSALALTAVGIAGVLLVGGVYRLGGERIAAHEAAARQAALRAVLPDLPTDARDETLQVQAPHWLGTREVLPVQRLRADGRLYGWVIEAVAPDGYSGDIRLLIGVTADGRIGGVRVLQHTETPGLGDPIHQDRGPWIDDFAGNRLGDPPAARWDVRKHGGDFDQFAGATVSPRAVVRAVARTLALLERHADDLARAEAGATLRYDDGPESAP